MIRETINQEGMVALGKVVFSSREHIFALEPRGKGMMGMTLRYPYEARNEADYFGDLPDEKVGKDMLDLAAHIVETKRGHFKPAAFEDHYEVALKELVAKKQHGDRIETPCNPEPTKVISLMDALRRSVEREGGEPRDKESARRASRRENATARRHVRKMQVEVRSGLESEARPAYVLGAGRNWSFLSCV